MSARFPSTAAARARDTGDADLTRLFSRSAGAPLVSGNAVRILVDAADNYPAWLSAIEAAERTIHLEMYIVHNDAIGCRFRDALIERARQGIAVRVLYDWFGAFRPSSYGFWEPLRRAGGEVRVVNPLRLDLVGCASRDHRKLLAVDGNVAFISGLCIGDDWCGDPEKGIAPWRDTGLELRGPAVAEAEYAFATSWALWGGGLPPGTVPCSGDLAPAGDVDVRVIATAPDRASLYRMELAAIAAAQEYIWLTDAYFMGTSVYIEALSATARHGVDVRLLLPHNSDVPWIVNMSRTLYRRLLEAGVRVYEWDGPMIHAKTAVADGRFVRLGSTNLNVSSWIGNWELDVTIDSEQVAARMEEVYDADLRRSTEITIDERHKVRPRGAPSRGIRRHGRVPVRRLSRAVGGGANRAIKNVALAGSVLGSAVRGYRVLGPHEAAALAFSAVLALVIAALAVFAPAVVSYPIAVAAAVLGITLAIKSWKASQRHRT